MMKRPVLIGSLLVLLAAPSAANALSPLCAQVLSAPAVSPYVREVIQRSNAGIPPVSGTSGGNLAVPDWAERIGGYFLWLIDAQLTTSEHIADLGQNSACLHDDILRLQCQIDKVREEVMISIGAGDTVRLSTLQAQIPFLKDRITALLAGATDPTFSDQTWGVKTTFDPENQQAWCCETAGSLCEQSSTCGGTRFYTLEGCVNAGKCTAPSGQDIDAQRQCPFSTDYGPAMRNGYGCDASVMGPRATYQSIQFEQQTLREAIDRLNGLSETIGGERSLPASHKVINGCKRTFGYCSEKKDVLCADDADCGKENAGTCTYDLPPDAAWNGVRSPFSMVKNHVGLVMKFWDLRSLQGATRTASSETKNSTGALSYLESLFRGGYRQDFGAWSRGQGQREVNPFIEGNDAQLRIAEALPSSGVGGLLKKVVTDPQNGLRGFIIRYSYFARRSCMNRPCSAKLEQIMRIAASNSCFPYAQTDEQQAGSPPGGWEQCAAEACIPLTNQPVDTSRCICYRVPTTPNFTGEPTEVSPDQADVCVPR